MDNYLTAKYYSESNSIVVYDENIIQARLLGIPLSQKKFFGFPPFELWSKTDFGYEIRFFFSTMPSP